MAIISIILSIRKQKTDKEVSFSSTARGLLEDVDRFRSQLQECREIAEHSNESIKNIEEHERECRKRLALLESVLPFALLGSGIDDVQEFLNSYSSVLDTLDNGFLIIIPTNEGKILWANLQFCLDLKMTRSEVLEKGWKKLIDPSYLTQTKLAESAAHADPILGFINCYINSDGERVWFKWYYSRYTITNLFKIPFSISIAKRLDFPPKEMR